MKLSFRIFFETIRFYKLAKEPTPKSYFINA